MVAVAVMLQIPLPTSLHPTINCQHQHHVITIKDLCQSWAITHASGQDGEKTKYPSSNHNLVSITLGSLGPAARGPVVGILDIEQFMRLWKVKINLYSMRTHSQVVLVLHRDDLHSHLLSRNGTQLQLYHYLVRMASGDHTVKGFTVY